MASGSVTIAKKQAITETVPSEIRRTRLRRIARIYEVQGSSARIIPMEGIRGLAVLLVFFVHFQGIFGSYLPDGSIAECVLLVAGTIGHAGVDLFFVLSGYLVYGLLIRKDTPYFTFVRRRVQRIYPAFLALFVTYLILSALLPQENKIQGTPLQMAVYVLQNVFLLPGLLDIRPLITVAWSLSLEFFFYLLAPIVVRVGHMRSWRPRWRIAFLLAVWTAHLLGCMWVPSLKPRMAEFTAGAVLFELVQSPQLRNMLRSWGQAVAAAAFLLSLALLVPHHSSAPMGADLGSPIGIGPKIVAPLSCGCFLLVLFSCFADGWLRSVFSWAPIRWLGNMSYSYYLIHGLALKALGFLLALSGVAKAGVTTVYFVFLPAAFVVAWGAATLLFVLVEKPFSIQVRKPTKTPKPAASVLHGAL
jgi:peptidoglycan/LPS O-acetylase OafA/YrhL